MSHFRDNTLFFQFHNRVNLTWFLLRKHNYPCSGSIQVNKDLSYYNNTKNQFLTMLKVNLKMCWNFFNHYWQILENSSKKFFRNFSFPGQTDFWKTHPYFSKSTNESIDSYDVYGDTRSSSIPWCYICTWIWPSRTFCYIYYFIHVFVSFTGTSRVLRSSSN